MPRLVQYLTLCAFLLFVAKPIYSQVSAQEREALIALYNSTDGANWLNNSEWLGEPGTECLWIGVTCDESQSRVIGLDLTANTLIGTLPKELGNLMNLADLTLTANELSGSIPAELASLTNLVTLDLSENQLSGSIPTQLGSLNKLSILWLSSNQLSGPIPTELGNLTELTFLFLNSNELSESIPAELGNLTNLEALDLSDNRLSGSIPAQLGGLTELNYFFLYSNRLSGAIPPELKNLTNISDLDISWNALFTDDDDLRSYLNSIQDTWESTQTIAPANLTATPQTNSSILVSWIPIAYSADPGGYQILYSTTSGGPYTLFGSTTDKTASSLEVTGLIASTAYYVVVQTVTDPHSSNRNAVISGLSAEVSATPGGGGSSDTVPPTVTMTAPANGSTVSGIITVSATATDNVGVAGVQFLLDGVATGPEDTAAPYEISLNTVSLSEGSHILSARARDAAGLTATAPAVTVTKGGSRSITITSIEPNSGSVTGETLVTINGAGFQNGVTVTIGSVAASVNTITASRINATTGAVAKPGSYDVVVTNPDGHSATLANGFTYTQVLPMLTSLDPASKVEGDPAFMLTINGSNFTDRAIVRWNETALVTKFINSNHLEAAVPTSQILTSGTDRVAVSLDGAVSSPLFFTIEANSKPPVLNGVLPHFGSSQGNTRIILLGNNFKPGMTGAVSQSVGTRSDVSTLLDESSTSTGMQFLLGGIPVTDLTFVDRTQLNAIAPSHSSGSVEVTMLQADGSQSSLPQAYTYKNLPAVPPSAPGGSQRQRIPFMVDDKEFRTNLGINNLGATTAEVTISLADNNGDLVAQMPTTVPPHGMTQILNVGRFLEGTSEITGREGYLILESSQKVAAWASQIDNLTADPSLQQSKSESAPASHVLIPSSTSLGPFLTSLVVINHSSIAGSVNIRSRHANGTVQASLNNQGIRPNGYLFLDDFYRKVGLNGVFGPIEIEAVGGIRITAAARIYTREGTSGYFEGVDVNLASKTTVLPYSVDTADFRTNLGITNPGDSPLNVFVSLVDGKGLTLGTLIAAVPPHGLTQINNINRKLLNTATISNSEAYLQLTADQPIFGWTSQIDNLTQDLSLVVGKSGHATKLIIPSTTSTEKFKSTLAVVNLAPTPTTVLIIARDIGGEPRGSIQVTIPANGLISYTDILASLGLRGTFGPMEINSVDNQPLLAVSRVYSPQHTGGYFEGLPIAP